MLRTEILSVLAKAPSAESFQELAERLLAFAA
jgi:hypothetical protein